MTAKPQAPVDYWLREMTARVIAWCILQGPAIRNATKNITGHAWW